MFASSLQAGLCQAFPDICLTPMPPPIGTVPFPYPNIAQCPTADSGTCSGKVFICNQKAFTRKTKIPQSQGDEAGTGGGIISGKIMGEATYMSGSFKVKFEGAPAVFQGSMTGQNGSPCNANGSQVQPSQSKVDILG